MLAPTLTARLRGALLLIVAASLPAAAARAQLNPSGWIETRGWNLLFRLVNGFGCTGGGEARMLRSWVAPHDVGSEDPKAGDVWGDIDFGGAAQASGYDFGNLFPAPTWITSSSFEADRGLAPGFLPNGDLVDFAALIGSINAAVVPVTPGATPIDHSSGLAIATTYIRNLSGAPLEVDLCTSSDDSLQVWVNGRVLLNHSECRGATPGCSEVSCAVLSPGVNRIAVLVWQGGGGWSFRLGVQLAGSGVNVVDGNGFVEFIGPGGPGELGQTFQPCPQGLCDTGRCFLRGDTNSTGDVDVSDAVLIMDFLFSGGTPPSCRAAADVNLDGSPNISDAIFLLRYLYDGGFPPFGAFPECELAPPDCEVSPDACRGTLRRAEPDFRLRLTTENVVEGLPGAAVAIPCTIQLLDLLPGSFRPDAWSLSVRSRPGSSLSIVEATTQGTRGADREEEKQGLRAGGGELTELTVGAGNEGAVSYLHLSTFGGWWLPREEGPHDLLRLMLAGRIPDSGCETCVLELRDGLVTSAGIEVKNRVGSLGDSVEPYSRPEVIHLCATLSVLVPGGSVLDLMLTPERPRALVKLAPTPEAGSSITLSLTDADPGDRNAVYARWDRIPSSTIFDFATGARSASSQRLVIPRSRLGTAYLLVEGGGFAGGANEVRLEATTSAFALERVSATCPGQGCAGRISLAVFGGGFDDSTSFHLEGPGGVRVEASETLIAGDDRAEVVFDLTGRSEGPYDLAATEDPDLEERLRGALRVAPPAMGPRLAVNLLGPRVHRAGEPQRLTVRWTNIGDEEMPAPLLLVEGPPGVDLRLHDAEDIDAALGACSPPCAPANRLQLLGVHRGGVAGRLPPGAAGEAAVIFTATCEDVRLEVKVLAAEDTDRLSWESLPAACCVSQEEWASVRGALAASLGPSWMSYHEALTETATRLSRRGLSAASVRDLFRFAYSEAAGRPSAYVIGVVRTPDGEPLSDRRVGALAKGGEALAACALTDAEGSFAIGPVTPGSYTLLVENRVTGSAEVTVQPGGDCLGVEVVATSTVTSLLECPEVGAGILPGAPPDPPAGLFITLEGGDYDVVCSIDPNDKEGPGEGFGVRRGEEIHYTVRFENLPGAEAAARRVEVCDVLDPELDPESVVFRDVAVGGRLFVLDSAGGRGRTSGYALAANATRSSALLRELLAVPFPRPEAPESLLLDIRAALVPGEATSGQRLEWWFQAIDVPTESDPRSGFLPPNSVRPRGEGLVSFTAKVQLQAPPKSSVENRAAIQFDSGGIILTNITSNSVVDSTASGILRGDPSGDGNLSAADVSYLNSYLAGRPLVLRNCSGEADADAADANDNEAVTIADALLILEVLLHGGTLPPPYPNCGSDPGDGRQGFDAVDPAFAIRAVRLREGPIDVEVDLEYQSAAPLRAFAFALEYAPELEPLVPALDTTGLPRVTTTPIQRAQDGTLVVAGRVTDPSGALLRATGAGFAPLGTLRFARSDPLAHAGMAWLAESDLGGVLYRATLVSDDFRDHHPRLLSEVPGPAPPRFLRGDANGDGKVDISDPRRIFDYLFLGGIAPRCLDAADANNDGGELPDISDGIYILGWLFVGAPAPLLTGRCEADPADAEDALDCGSYSFCP